MMKFDHKKSPLVKTILVTCVMGALVGCGSNLSDNDPKRQDVRLQHPIQVAREQVSVTINLPAQGTSLAPEDVRRLRGFIRNFVGRGRTAVTVESQMGAYAREFLIAQGLRANEIILAPDTTVKAPSAVLTFTANVAQVPKCGDWSESATFSPTNISLPDFGCSNRRNIGLIVADPGDLIESQPMSGRGAARRDTVLDSYNSGEPIGPVTAPLDTQAVSGTSTQ